MHSHTSTQEHENSCPFGCKRRKKRTRKEREAPVEAKREHNEIKAAHEAGNSESGANRMRASSNHKKNKRRKKIALVEEAIHNEDSEATDVERLDNETDWYFSNDDMSWNFDSDWPRTQPGETKMFWNE